MKWPDWRNRSVACLASGPSLTAADCDLVRASGRLTVVANSTFRLCPWADALYCFDPPWWRKNIEDLRRDFRGQCFTQWTTPPKDILCARLNPKFRSFGNAGANAISLAIMLGARDIVLLGYDCSLGPNGETHHFGDHEGLRNCDTLPQWPAQFAKLAEYANSRGARVVNATRRTALTCFPLTVLEVAL
jgi:hypothetical protein